MSIYLFVDGGYLDRAYHELISIWGVPGEIDLRAVSARGFSNDIDRVFYYHAVDHEKRSGETEEQAKARVEAMEARLDAINSLDGFHVREGSVSRRRDNKKREQKEVDVLLAVDMLTHSFSKNIRRAILLSGDIDFLPVVDAVANLGVMVEVWCERKSAAKALYRRADRVRILSPEDAIKWTRPDYREQLQLQNIDTRGNLSRPLNALIYEGLLAGTAVAFFQNHGRWNLVLGVGDKATAYCHPSPDVAIRYVQYRHSAAVAWNQKPPFEAAQ